jgi:hypothetical protein
MTTGVTTQPRTAAAFLFGGSQDSSAALAQALVDKGVVGSLGAAVQNLTRAGRGAVGSQIASAAHGLMDLDLDNILIGGWRKYADMMAAAKRTITEPGSREIVELATHSITFRHEPYVKVLVNDALVATVHFEMSLKFTVKGLVAAIRDGQLVSLHSGDCDVAGTLSAEGRQLAKREAHVQLPVLVRLGDGIPLVRKDEDTPPAPKDADTPPARKDADTPPARKDERTPPARKDERTPAQPAAQPEE